MSKKMSTNHNIERLNFLIVDDNKHMRALVKGILHALGSKSIHEATDGADAFKELHHFHADIIICDWSMSPIDGIAFSKMIRTNDDSPNPYIPIIMLTGHTELYRVAESRDAGINEFLAKPISAQALFSRIRLILDQPRPFISEPSYTGPDRRRKTIEWTSEERRITPPNIVKKNSQNRLGKIN